MFKFKLFIKSLFLSTLAVSAISNSLAKNSPSYTQEDIKAIEEKYNVDYSNFDKYEKIFYCLENETKKDCYARSHEFYRLQPTKDKVISLFKPQSQALIKTFFTKKEVKNRELLTLLKTETGFNLVNFDESKNKFSPNFKEGKAFRKKFGEQEMDNLEYRLSYLDAILRAEGIKTNINKLIFL
ncbi:hypothetical protein [Avibacterium avium]|uniref:hypothetical protein n=1 Tax=Avibacterium avium TaxID=751 RepID=UPI003BF7DFA4